MLSPLISVIIPAYNRAQVIGTALDSVASQDYSDVEIIVIDDGSSDADELRHVMDVFRENSGIPVTLVHQENTGPGGARAHGLRLSRGRFIQYLDSDDMLLPEAFRRHVEALESNPDAVMAYGITMVEQPDGSRTERKFARNYVPDFLEATLQWRRWNTSNPLWRYPGEDWRNKTWWSDAATNQDFVHDVRVACHNQQMVFVPEPSMLYRVVTDDRRSTERGVRITETRFLTMTEARSAMTEAGLMGNPRYGRFFAERCFFEAIQAAKYGCWDISVQLSDWALMHFPGPMLKAEALVEVVAMRAFRQLGISLRISTGALKRLFRLHKRLHSVELHLNRTP